MENIDETRLLGDSPSVESGGDGAAMPPLGDLSAQGDTAGVGEEAPPSSDPDSQGGEVEGGATVLPPPGGPVAQGGAAEGDAAELPPGGSSAQGDESSAQGTVGEPSAQGGEAGEPSAQGGAAGGKLALQGLCCLRWMPVWQREVQMRPEEIWRVMVVMRYKW